MLYIQDLTNILSIMNTLSEICKNMAIEEHRKSCYIANHSPFLMYSNYKFLLYLLLNIKETISIFQIIGVKPKMSHIYVESFTMPFKSSSLSDTGCSRIKKRFFYNHRHPVPPCDRQWASPFQRSTCVLSTAVGRSPFFDDQC